MQKLVVSFGLQIYPWLPLKFYADLLAASIDNTNNKIKRLYTYGHTFSSRQPCSGIQQPCPATHSDAQAFSGHRLGQGGVYRHLNPLPIFAEVYVSFPSLLVRQSICI